MIRADCTLERVVDGDTLVVRVDARPLHPEYATWLPKIRLAKVDAAELNERNGALARDTVTEFFAAPFRCELQATGRDKYGRLVADILRSDGKRLSEQILALPGSEPVSLQAQLDRP